MPISDSNGFEESAAILRQVIAAEPANAAAYAVLSKIYSSYARANERGGHDSRPQRGVAQVYAKLALALAPDSEIAREAAELAAEKKRPENFTVHPVISKGKSLLDKTIEDLEKTRELNPGDSRVAEGLQMLYEERAGPLKNGGLPR